MSSEEESSSMECDQVERDEVIEKYLTGRLSSATRDAFEAHYFSCADCFSRLQSYQALQAELGQTDPESSPVANRRHAFRRWAWAASAAAAALVLVTVGLRILQEPPESGSLALRASLDELAHVEAPPYLPVFLRGERGEAAECFRAAMTHYGEGDYPAAILGLEAAAELAPSAANVRFFLAICYLLTDQTELAIAGLQETLALEDAAYREESLFYLAKARLRGGDVGNARQLLNETIREHGRLESRAHELVEQLQEVE